MTKSLLIVLIFSIAEGFTSMSRAAQAGYDEIVQHDRPILRVHSDSGGPILSHAANFADQTHPLELPAGASSFSIEWWQFVPRIEGAQPSLRIGDIELIVRPLPRAKPKDPPRATFSAGKDLRSATLVSPGKWYHVIFSVDSDRARFFINGQPDAAPAEFKIRPAVPLVLHGDPSGESLIDELAVYGFALTPDQASAHFKAAINSLPPRAITTAGHRGNNRFAPENTRISYVEAVELGAPVVEMDLHLTKDNHIVLMHDHTVDRTTSGKGKVSDLTVAELQKLDAGSWKNAKYKGEPVPTIEQIADVCRGRAIMMLDLKATGLGQAICDWLSSTSYPGDKIILAPWEDEEGVALRKYLPTQPMIRLGSNPPKNWDDAYFERMKQIGFSAFSINWQNLPQAFIDAAHKHDMKVWAWTVNDPPEIAGVALAGCDGIITDDPAATMKFLSILTAR